MGKKKKKRKFKPKTFWILFSSYMIVGVGVALFVLNSRNPTAATTEAGQQAANSIGALFPIIVMLWPIFLIIHIVRQFI